MTHLAIALNSDACFGGSKLSLLADVDRCTELDAVGLPTIGGRALRGLLIEETALLLAHVGSIPAWREAARDAFGEPRASTPGQLRVGNACFPEEEHRALDDPALYELNARTFTLVRRQTRIDRDGVAADHSLRATRLARAGAILTADLRYRGLPLGNTAANASVELRALVATAARLMRRGGLHRSRGWGRLECTVWHEGEDVTASWSAPLLDLLGGNHR